MGQLHWIALTWQERSEIYNMKTWKDLQDDQKEAVGPDMIEIHIL